MGVRKTKPVITRTVADATPEGSIQRTAVATATNVDEEYDFPLDYPFGEGGGLFGNNMPIGRASLTQADLATMRRQQRENYDMYTEDTRAQQREARGVFVNGGRISPDYLVPLGVPCKGYSGQT